MGYTTDFWGEFTVTPALKPEHLAYLKQFGDTRRMKRDATKAEKMPDPIRDAACLPVGPEGSFFVGATGHAGQDKDDSIVEYNDPPVGQPGLWCQWIPSEDGTSIAWDGSEKFYCYAEWLEYLIENFLDPWGYVLDGEVQWQGEESGDMGKLIVEDNLLQTKHAIISYE